MTQKSNTPAMTSDLFVSVGGGIRDRSQTFATCRHYNRFTFLAISVSLVLGMKFNKKLCLQDLCEKLRLIQNFIYFTLLRSRCSTCNVVTQAVGLQRVRKKNQTSTTTKPQRVLQQVYILQPVEVLELWLCGSSVIMIVTLDVERYCLGRSNTPVTPQDYYFIVYVGVMLYL